MLVNNDKKYSVVVPSSIAWIRFAIVALDSYVRATSSHNETDFSILVPGECSEEARLILSEANVNFDFEVRGFPSELLSGYPITSRWGEVSWYRTLLPSLPEWAGYEKILLLGVDVWCQSLAMDLFAGNSSHSIAAVREPKNSPTYQFAPFDVEESRYFNADVLLYDCSLWHQNKDTDELRERILSSDVIYPFSDQDFLNNYFFNCWEEWPANLNWIPALNSFWKSRLVEDDFIAQWAGKWKPWDGFLVPPFGLTNRWRREFHRIWSKSSNSELLAIPEGLSFRIPSLAMISYYFPALMPFLLYLNRLRRRLRRA
jgi:lipopolysaccharide biosynthesis glycosyltransferase